ncbi:MAG: 5'/3'-nucleotidase SurE, partial [Bdellovibrionales bacterium]|nr:5'/3'-nucleotidase SurE [Bdellovibrionales bacterium]
YQDPVATMLNAVLVTNDDGPDSPLALPFIEALSSTLSPRELRIVLPDTEQSWISQAVSRFRPIETRERRFGRHPGYVASGTPADCSSLGIHNLYGSPPDVVFSGVNLGVNAGLAFFLSSGTVGGASEAMLARIRAAAFSAEVPSHIFRTWRSGDMDELKRYTNRFRALASAAARVAKHLVDHDAWRFASLFSVNLPWNVNDQTVLRITSLAETYFGPLFTSIGENLYQHRHEGLIVQSPEVAAAADEGEHEPREPFSVRVATEAPWDREWSLSSSFPQDLRVVAEGCISLTPITYTVSTPFSAAGVSELETFPAADENSE